MPVLSTLVKLIQFLTRFSVQRVNVEIALYKAAVKCFS